MQPSGDSDFLVLMGYSLIPAVIVFVIFTIFRLKRWKFKHQSHATRPAPPPAEKRGSVPNRR